MHLKILPWAGGVAGLLLAFPLLTRGPCNHVEVPPNGVSGKQDALGVLVDFQVQLQVATYPHVVLSQRDHVASFVLCSPLMELGGRKEALFFRSRWREKNCQEFINCILVYLSNASPHRSLI